MSKQNRRSGGSFRTLGQRMLSFGRGIMRTYANETSLQPDTTTNEPQRPRGQWRSMTTDSLVWRQEQPAPTSTPPPAQADVDYYDEGYDDYDEVDTPQRPRQQPIQRAPERPRQQPVQRQQQPQPRKPTPSYVQTNDGTPIRASDKQFSNPIQRRLEAIMQAHAQKNAVRDQERDKKFENIQRKVERGEMTTRRRRGSIDVDYVQTESLLPVEDRGKENESPIQAQRQDSTDSSSSASGDMPDVNAGADEANWFDEIPDDDADIDNIAGFESSDDALQRMPDDLPVFDASNLDEEEEASDDVGEFESGYDNFPSQSAESNDVMNRDYDDDEPTYDEPVDDNAPSFDGFDAPVQRRVQDYDDLPFFDDADDETVPLVPSSNIPDTSSTPSSDAPIQRSELENRGDGNDDGDTMPSVDSSPSNTLPIQRTPLQRDDVDRDDFPNFLNESTRAFDNTPSYTDFSDVNNSPPGMSGDTPIQRDESDSDDGWYSDYSDVSDSSPSAPSDTPIQRDYDADSGSYRDYSDVSDSSPSAPSDTPIQRDYDAEADSGSYSDYSDVSDSSPSASSDTPIQRDYDAEADSGSYSDYSDVSDSSPSAPSDTPIQRDYDAEADSGSYSDYSDVSDSSPSMSGDTPIQRDYGDVPDVNASSAPRGESANRNIQRASDDVNNFEVDADADFDDVNTGMSVESQTPASDTPVQRDDIQRREIDDFDAGGGIPVDEDSGPQESLSISAPQAPSPDPRPVQRQADPTDESTPEVSDDTTSTNDSTLPVQRQTDYADYADLGDGGDYSDYGDQTWAEANDYSPASDTSSPSDTSIQRSELEDEFDADAIVDMPDVGGELGGESPVQRDRIQRSELEDEFDADAIVDMPDVGGEPGGESPVQRDRIQRSELEDEFDADAIVDMSDVGGEPGGESLVQRDRIQRSELDNGVEADDGNIPTVDAGDSLTIQPPSGPQSNLQRDVDDNYSEYGDQTWAEANDYAPASDATPPTDTSIQRDFDDETYDVTDYQVTDDVQSVDNPVSIQPSAVQRSEMDDRTFDIIGDMNEFNIQSPADSSSLQRTELDEPQSVNDDYSEYGDQTWAEANDYSPASDVTSPTDAPIQRDVDDGSTEAEFDHLENTDGQTAMDILGDYIASQSAETNPSANRPSVQRQYQDDTYDYLPEDFDPTPSFYNFDQQPNNRTSEPSGDAPIQRDMQDDRYEDTPTEQPIDLFSALAQAGLVETHSSASQSSTPQTPIQRDMQDDGTGTDDDYSEYGDATWAELNNYSPATEGVNSPADSSIQRSVNDDNSGDASGEQPIDLFSALAQAGALNRKPSNQQPNGDSIQRSADDEPETGDFDGSLNQNNIDLYNALLQSGAIQDSSKASSSSGGDPIQRSVSGKSLADAFAQASRVSESSAANRSSVNTSNSSSSGESINPGAIPIPGIVQRNESSESPVAPSEAVTNPTTERDKSKKAVEEEDQKYLSQLARDVFRVIKRRLREEQERRGK